jgi:hypothetical protein
VGRRFLSVGEQRRGERGQVVGPRRPRAHPTGQDRLFFRRERIGVGRHPRLGVVGRDTADDLARLWLPGHDPGKPGVAAGEGPLAIIDPPAALGRGRTVAGPTAAGEERSDDGGEIRGICRGRLRSGKPRSGQPRQQKPEGSEARETRDTARDHVETPRATGLTDRSPSSLPSRVGACQPRRCSRTSRSRAS